MDISLNAETFFKSWCEIADSNKTVLLDKWGDDGEYTSFVLYDKNGLIYSVGYDLGLKTYTYSRHGYYGIDAVLYKDIEDIIPDSSISETWLRWIRIAIEHENQFNYKLYQEISRLLITNCALRVLITYPKNSSKQDEILQKIHSIIRDSVISKPISDNDTFLIILGSGFDSDEIQWEGLVYKEDKWKALHCNHMT